MLRFDKRWRRTPPADGRFINAVIPRAAVEDYMGLIRRLTMQGDKKYVFEMFKQVFSAACGEAYYSSSSTSWAESDLDGLMHSTADNPPTFIDALWSGFESLRREGTADGSEWYYLPDADDLNEVAERHKIGYWLDPPDLKLREDKSVIVAVEERPYTLADEALEQFERSLHRAEELLREGKGREAVQESLWLLESVSTAFKGLDVAGGTIGGKYFNQIAKELKRSFQGTTLEQAIDWMTKLHGYLSSPTGGGVRHGVDLRQGVAMQLNEARLFCNLIRSYMAYLINEHTRLVANSQAGSA